MNKKGSLDSPVILISLLVIGVALYAALLITTTGQTALSSTPSANNLLNGAITMFTRMGNTGFGFITFGLILFNVIGAFLLTTKPIFVIIDLIFMPISIYIAVIVSNAYEASLGSIALVTNTFLVMNFIMLHLPSIIVVTDIITAIMGYALIKDRFG